jgi:hypothetical protein
MISVKRLQTNHLLAATVNHTRLLELFWEFSSKIEELHALYLDSIVGYSILHERLIAHQDSIRATLGNHECASKEFQDTCSIAYKNLSNRDFTPVSMSPGMKQGAMKKRVSYSGRNSLLLGNLCLVSAYDYWEEYLRIEVGKAIGVIPQDAKADKSTEPILKEHVQSDFWGDVRHIRTSIVHNNGIAISKIAHCKAIKWFLPGQTIELDQERMHTLFLEMGYYRNELHTMSLAPPHAFYAPGAKGD